MIFDVFMSRIRSSQFANTMSATDPKTKSLLFNGKTVFANIYKLLYESKGQTNLNALNPKPPTKTMLNIIEKAQNVGTKLWLNKNELDLLIASGRITLCQSLLDFVWNAKKHNHLPKPNDPTSPFHYLQIKWKKLLDEYPD
jgi:hypothetical protein